MEPPSLGRYRVNPASAGLVTPPRGGLGSPSDPTKRVCLEWLDAVRTKAGESRPDQGRQQPPVAHPEARSRGQKSRDGAPRGATPSQEGVHIRNGCANRRSIPSRFSRGTKGKTADPAAAKNAGGEALASQSPLRRARKIG